MMKKLADGGIEITALHNHLLGAQPADDLYACPGPRRCGEAGATLQDAQR